MFSVFWKYTFNLKFNSVLFVGGILHSRGQVWGLKSMPGGIFSLLKQPKNSKRLSQKKKIGHKTSVEATILKLGTDIESVFLMDSVYTRYPCLTLFHSRPPHLTEMCKNCKTKPHMAI